jgi:hypothetical protein
MICRVDAQSKSGEEIIFHSAMNFIALSTGRHLPFFQILGCCLSLDTKNQGRRDRMSGYQTPQGNVHNDLTGIFLPFCSSFNLEFCSRCFLPHIRGDMQHLHVSLEVSTRTVSRMLQRKELAEGADFYRVGRSVRFIKKAIVERFHLTGE